MHTDFSFRVEPLESRIAPATFTVTNLTDSDPGSLRDALAMADAHAGHDTIVFHLPKAAPNTENIIGLSSTELTSMGNVTIKGPGAGKLILDGHGTKRILDINDGDTNTDSPTVISGLAFVRGSTNPGLGGGIYSAESLTLKNVIVSGCTAQNGGGVCVYDRTGAQGAKAVISHSLITGNTAQHGAGGLDLGNLKSISISKTVVTGNAATTNGGGIFAGVNSGGTGIAITGCVISGNSAGYGGGVYVSDANLSPTSKITISSTKITGNAGSDNGGGLFIAAGNAVVNGSTIGNNSAGNDGGGIDAHDFSSLMILGSTITGNRATNKTIGYHGGGGIYLNGGGSGSLVPVKIIGSRVTDNQSAYAGGGLLAYGGCAVTISGSAFSRNTAANNGGGIFTGGAAANTVNLTVAGSVFADNFANDGGGIEAFSSGDFSITASKVTGNTATDTGGGIVAYTGGAVAVKNVVATDNFASGDGGGLFIRGASNFKVIGGSFTGNAAKYGGGIAAYNASGSILGVAVTGNTAASSGGGVFNGGLTPGTLILDLAKIVGNAAANGPDVSPIPL